MEQNPNGYLGLVALSVTYSSKSHIEQNPIQLLQDHWDELAQVIDVFNSCIFVFSKLFCGSQAIPSLGFSSLMCTKVLLL